MTNEMIIAKQTIEIENLKEVVRNNETVFQTIEGYITSAQTTPQIILNKITHQLPRA
jgi:hypothetical protein